MVLIKVDFDEYNNNSYQPFNNNKATFEFLNIQQGLKGQVNFKVDLFGGTQLYII